MGFQVPFQSLWSDILYIQKVPWPMVNKVVTHGSQWGLPY